MNYTKLIERLRVYANEGAQTDAARIAQREVADAIEALQSKLDTATQSSAHWQHQCTELQAENERLKKEATKYKNEYCSSHAALEIVKVQRDALKSTVDAMDKGEALLQKAMKLAVSNGWIPRHLQHDEYLSAWALMREFLQEVAHPSSHHPAPKQAEPVGINGLTEAETNASMSVMGLSKPQAQEPVAWEATTPGYIKYVTDKQYRSYSETAKRWYKPYKCSSCTTPKQAEPAHYGPLFDADAHFGKSLSVYDEASSKQAEPETQLGWLRYEKLRKLSPVQYAELHKRNLQGEFFDSMVDALPEPSTPKPWEPAIKESLTTPEGYTLVPIVATPEMMAAGDEVEDLYRRGTPETWGKVYRAMLAAAPTPPEAA